MKKIIIGVLLYASIFSAYSFVPSYLIKEVGGGAVSTDIPDAVLNNFDSMFPGAVIAGWKVLTGVYNNVRQYLVVFKVNNVKRVARYASDGVYLGGL
jgi:hypothetical protein